MPGGTSPELEPPPVGAGGFVALGTREGQRSARAQFTAVGNSSHTWELGTRGLRGPRMRANECMIFHQEGVEVCTTLVQWVE